LIKPAGEGVKDGAGRQSCKEVLFVPEKLRMILGFHCHFPIAFGDKEFEDLYHEKLFPLLHVLNKFPEISVVLHFSGSLLYRIERSHSEFFVLLEKMVKRRQVELLGGGFYEPMLFLMSHSDRIGQVELLTTYLRKHFGKRVCGCYLPPECWDADLVSSLNEAEMEFTFLSEELFRIEGVRNDSYKYRPCITEDKGRTLIVFPVLEGFYNDVLVSGSKARFEQIVNSALLCCQNPVVAIFPCLEANCAQSNVNVSENITALFQTLSECKDSIELTHPSKIIKTENTLPRIYIQSLPIKQYLIRRPQSANLYSKILWTKRIIDKIRGDKSRKISATEELWKAQGYRLFCRTSFDEPDLAANPVVRSCAYQKILFAEQIAMGVRREWTPVLSEEDFNFDGEMEYIFHGYLINCFIQKIGASVFELDYLPKTGNYLSTYSAQDGAEHERKERLAFMDRLLSTEDDFFALARDCSAEKYEVAGFDRKRGRIAFFLGENPKSGAYGFIETKKEYFLEENELYVSWVFKNKGGLAERFYFVSEVNLSFSSDDYKNLRVYSCLREGIEEEKKECVKDNVLIQNINALEFQDLQNETIIRVKSESKINARYVSVRTKTASPYSKNEYDFYQSTAIFLSKYIELDSFAEYKIQYNLGIY
jgi:hypothetical protein